MSFGPEHLAKMISGLVCFNDQHYWECHEELEHVWLEDRQDPTRNVYWAVIQVAASMIHYREKNIIGASGMLNKSREKFKRVRELHIISPFLMEKLDWEKLEALVAAVPEKPTDLSAFAPIFEFRFRNYQ
mgnify:CR=1 FL=1